MEDFWGGECGISIKGQGENEERLCCCGDRP